MIYFELVKLINLLQAYQEEKKKSNFRIAKQNVTVHLRGIQFH